MNLDELAQVGLNAPMPVPSVQGAFDALSKPAVLAAFEAGKKAATDHIIAALLCDMAARNVVASE